MLMLMRWPILTKHPMRLHVAKRGDGTGRHFKALRNTVTYNRRTKMRVAKRRWHIGIDLYANEHDSVVAIADGTIIRAGVFRSSKSSGKRDDGSEWSVDSATIDHGSFVARYAEIKLLPGYEIGRKVSAGEVFATVERQKRSCMCHFELYKPGTKRGVSGGWLRGKAQPRDLLDPTNFLDSLALDERAREALVQDSGPVAQLVEQHQA